MRTIRGWNKAQQVLEGWRRSLTDLQVSLKRARAIEITPVDLVTGESLASKESPKRRFKSKLIYFTNEDLTLRRPSGALLIVDTYELASLSDGKTRVLP